jgi:phospholipase/carboxylesterase
MATQLLRTRPERIAATVVLSGAIHAAPQPADEQLAAERPAVFWGRGARDQVITADAIKRTAQWLPAHSTLTERVYPGLAHGIDNQEISDVRAFLRERIASSGRPLELHLSSLVKPRFLRPTYTSISGDATSVSRTKTPVVLNGR